MASDSPRVLIAQPPNATEKQDRKILLVYLYYRFILGLLLALILLTARSEKLVGGSAPDQYLYSAVLYSFLALLALFWRHKSNSQAQLSSVFFIDIVALILMSDASGGVNSGIPILLTIPVAASAILLNNTLATLVAALSTIALLSDTLRLAYFQIVSIKTMVPTGLIGLLFFVVSVVVQLLSKRLRSAQDLAQQHAQDLYSLQHLNEKIVQSMKTGILLIDEQQRVKVINPSAIYMLDTKEGKPVWQGLPLNEYNSDLSAQFTAWLEDNSYTSTAFDIKNTNTKIMPSFMLLSSPKQKEYLIFLEDYGLVLQQLQHLKLASLGRLTASIAHEIRNPLSAVNHAAQLLQESTHFEAADKRLTDIIEDHVKRINSIIENVQQISRRGAANTSRIFLDTWLPKFCKDIELAREQAVQLELDILQSDLSIEFDHTHLEQILTNLIENALRYSQPIDGRPWAKIAISSDQKKEITISIIDNGSGVPEEDITKVFEPFYTTAEQGSGLGLYISRNSAI